MRKTLVLIVFLTILLVIVAIYGTRVAVAPNRDFFLQENSQTLFYQPANREFSVVVLKDNYVLDLIYQPDRELGLTEVALENDFRFVINGGYFIDNEGKIIPSGLLKTNDEVISQQVEDLAKQVTHIFAYDRETGIASIIPESDYILNDNDELALQSGPLVVENSVIKTKEIEESINGNQNALRSLIGTTSKGEVILVTARTSMTLEQIATEVLELEILGDREITLLNLDGGSSTAFYSKDLDRFSFGENKLLPILIGVE